MKSHIMDHSYFLICILKESQAWKQISTLNNNVNSVYNSRFWLQFIFIYLFVCFFIYVLTQEDSNAIWRAHTARATKGKKVIQACGSGCFCSLDFLTV